ncbi:hypothetical protein AC579_2786 [Pseudocercospora musae]|uniref:Uncharacterized protein n=1 Tax=Pseudocercospora musae TaxID=113226 RepID=A0A139HZK2_9PEZI|nr:hypothetical protein AC579_2786 [Pseudocercospora musae]
MTETTGRTRRLSCRLRFRFRFLLAVCITTRGKNFVEIVLEPSNIWIQPRKFPNPLHFFVPVEIEGVGVAFYGYGGHGFVCVFLVGDAELMVSGKTPPELLGFEGWVSQDCWVGGHFYEFFGWHFFPEFVEEGTVVDSQGSSCVSANPGMLAVVDGMEE